MHGICFIVDDNSGKFEKIIWSCILLLAVTATIYVSIILSKRFNKNSLATVIDSTIYPVYEIPFPAITICNYNRINWKRIDQAEKKFFVTSSNNNNNSTSDLFRRFINKFNNFEYGNFDEFDEFENVSLNELDNINLNDLIDFMSFKCNELFEDDCWWRNKDFKCCDIFAKQKTEYGYCYSFNSLTNDYGKMKSLTDFTWPWRTSTSGEWSGLRFKLKIDPLARPPHSTQYLGAMVIVHHPEEWPSIGVFVPINTASSIKLKPKLSYAEDETRTIKPKARDCIFPDETPDYKYETLPGLKYLLGNCISNCRRVYILQYCNCSIDFFFPDDNFQACKASDFHCLNKYYEIFSYEKTLEEEFYINHTGQGMICLCIHECYTIDYRSEVTPFQLANDSITSNGILLDVHYQRNTLLKYRTNIVFGWIDLLVAFGGIAGLFLGCSIISGFEILYCMIVSLILYFKQIYSNKLNKSNTIFGNKENVMKHKIYQSKY